jgi:hypothetical protein
MNDDKINIKNIEYQGEVNLRRKNYDVFQNTFEYELDYDE